MADSDEEQTNSLRYKRFNKFENTTTNKDTIHFTCINNENSVTTLKRKYSEDIHQNEYKKRKESCPYQSPPKEKNLANNRLKQLCQKLRSPTSEILDKVNAKDSKKTETSPRLCSSDLLSNEIFQKRTLNSMKNADSPTTPRISYTPVLPQRSNSTSKYSANKRLEKLKQSLALTESDLNKTPEQVKLEMHTKSEISKNIHMKRAYNFDNPNEETPKKLARYEFKDNKEQYKEKQDLGDISSDINPVDKTSWTLNWLIRTQSSNSNSPFTTEIMNDSTAVVAERKNLKFQNESSCDDDQMEWTFAEPEETVKSLSTNLQEEKTEISTEQKEVPDNTKLNDICLVVDTNVFLSHFDKIEELLNMKVESIFKPLIYVPWMVINELDHIKDNYHDKKDVKAKACKAIKKINEYLSKEHPRLKGQSVYDVEQQKQIGKSPDDKIIACSLQALEKYNSVILVSNDVNLQNKALINNLPVCSADEIRMKIMIKLRTSIKAQRLLKKMEFFCSAMISHFSKKTFGDVWNKMALLEKPPWLFSDCLKIFKKYWFTVFQDKLLKHFKGNLDDLQKMLASNKGFHDIPEFRELKKKCIEICIHFKDIEEVRAIAQNTIDEIKEL